MRRWTRLALALVALLLLMACQLEQLYLEAYIESNRDALDTPVGSDATPITFTIDPGQSVTEIAGNLKAQRLISDTELFRRYVQYKNLDAGIQAGTYTLRQTMTIPEIAQALQTAQAPDQQVTIPEGKRLEEVAEIVADQTTIASTDFIQLAQTGWRGTALEQDHTFLARIPVTGTLEGFLFPDTYRLPVDATAEDLVSRMLDNFSSQVTPVVEEGFAQHGMSLYEGITLAAIVEREAVIDAERPVIAGVYHNRLRDGWFLSACPTVQYALGYRPDEETWWKSFLTFDDLENRSPYNTYRNLGLPPGPIASPGINAILAAAQPAETQYYFFMVDCSKNDGSHLFAVTEEEHLANFNRCGGVITSP
ncbi:MAG: endolytic transglycosylase MltG [Anaerolineae bacterium]|nr:endolytic transglycosylase MltG [Anaerolineae bacterium]